jgi:hypothetical protein
LYRYNMGGSTRLVDPSGAAFNPFNDLYWYNFNDNGRGVGDACDFTAYGHLDFGGDVQVGFD